MRRDFFYTLYPRFAPPVYNPYYSVVCYIFMKPSSTSTPTSPVAVSFTFLVLYLAGLSAFGSFVNDMYTPSLPSMCRYFHCSVPVVQLGLTMGMLGLGIGQIVLGPVSYRYGRKPVLVASILFFIAAATVSIFSPTIHFFLVCRFFQGIGASGGYFLARTIPADVYGGRRLAKAMAVMGAINGFAPASAPVIGGFISERFDWKGIFQSSSHSPSSSCAYLRNSRRLFPPAHAPFRPTSNEIKPVRQTMTCPTGPV